ncbi:MAG TPA: glucose 1-dehydrogenase [Solirubrobacteraceae bacterium]|jgi:NAD(P)-dependent dehydrogenase (short-subunit alcohol dehydrogenase family)|nr:glucose 1-dehydrogenase [Solirubrobacteraceae bacterium]
MSRPVAVVTGAGSGIGAAIARELSRRGFELVVTDIDADSAGATVGSLDGEGWSETLDVTDGAAAQRLADSVAERHGRLDVWVSNAGISHMHRFVDVTEQDLERTLAVNLKGVFLCGQAAARTMRRLGNGGVIVNTASMAGKQGRVPFLSDYVASKFGVVGLTQAMAYELAADAIRVNCVCPGYVATAMQERELAWEAELRGGAADDVKQMWVLDTPMGRLEEPEDVARAVAFLAGPDAGFITGEALAVNGGAFMD